MHDDTFREASGGAFAQAPKRVGCTTILSSRSGGLRYSSKGSFILGTLYRNTLQTAYSIGSSFRELRYVTHAQVIQVHALSKASLLLYGS